MDLSARRPGPDVTRALAMAGVVMMNYYGYSILRGAERGDGPVASVFDPWTGPLATRFAATFVVTAGIGVWLMFDRATTHEQRVDVSWRLVRRGLLLYGGGLAFDLVWPGTILPFYGVMFVVAAVLVHLRTRWIVAMGVAAAVAAWLIRWWRLERELDGFSTAWLTDPDLRSLRGLALDVMVNGTHPLLPWLAFMCAGIVVARSMRHAAWQPITAAIGGTLYVVATLVDAAAPAGYRARILLSDDPFERGIVYTASALGTALLAVVAITALADRWASTPAVDSLRRAGQLSLSIYLAHALIYRALVADFDLVRPRSLADSLVFAAVVWASTTAAAVAYQRRFGRGPAETLYRRLTA